MLNKLLLAERILMQTLCFDLQLIHPYKICLDKIKDKLKCTYFFYFYLYLLFVFLFALCHFFFGLVPLVSTSVFSFPSILSLFFLNHFFYFFSIFHFSKFPYYHFPLFFLLLFFIFSVLLSFCFSIVYIPADSRQAFHQNALNFLNDR